MNSEKALAAFLVGNAAVKFVLLLRGSRKRPVEAVLVGRVAELYLHPVKSCAPLAITEGYCSYSGLIDGEHGFLDRTFMCADVATMSRQTLRDHPKMNLIIPSFSSEGKLVLNGPGMDTLTINIMKPEGEAKIVKISDRQVWGLDCGEEGAQWLSAYLGAPMRLLYTDPKTQKNVMKDAGSTKWHQATEPKDRTVFQDFSPFNITVQASLDELNTRLDKTIDIRQFRPNILVEGCPAWDEDNWGKIFIGEDTCLTILKPCDRCVLINVSAETGEKDPDQQPLKKLKEYRVQADLIANKPLFGLQLTLEYGGNIKVGDQVYAIRGPRWWEKST